MFRFSPEALEVHLSRGSIAAERRPAEREVAWAGEMMRRHEAVARWRGTERHACQNSSQAGRR